jgi:hypothetical protein
MSIEAMKQLLSYDSETGEFIWTDKAPTKVAGKPANAKDSLGYICLRVDGKMYKAHRIAWAFVYGEWPELHIDHINGDPSDNRICNLREVDRHANMQNERKARLNNKSGYLGVCPNGGNWRAEIRVDGKKINLGTYKTPKEAHEAYVVAKRKFHEGATL